MSNAHEVMPVAAPDAWKDFGDWGSGAYARGAGSAWNSVSIDMTHHTGLVIRMKPGDLFTAAENANSGLGISIQRNSSAAGKKVQWAGWGGFGDNESNTTYTPVMGEFDTERLANTLVANEEVYFVFGGQDGLALLGMDDICISFKNQEGGSRTMESIEYRRTGFRPYG